MDKSELDKFESFINPDLSKELIYHNSKKNLFKK